MDNNGLYSNKVEKCIVLNLCTDATGLQFFIVYYSSLDGDYKPGYEIGEHYEETDFAMDFSKGLKEEAITENMIFKHIFKGEIIDKPTYPSIFLGTKPADEEAFKLSLANTIKLIMELKYPYYFAKNGSISEKKNRRENDYLREADKLYFAQEGKTINEDKNISEDCSAFMQKAEQLAKNEIINNKSKDNPTSTLKTEQSVQNKTIDKSNDVKKKKQAVTKKRGNNIPLILKKTMASILPKK